MGEGVLILPIWYPPIGSYQSFPHAQSLVQVVRTMRKIILFYTCTIWQLVHTHMLPLVFFYDKNTNCQITLVALA